MSVNVDRSLPNWHIDRCPRGREGVHAPPRIGPNSGHSSISPWYITFYMDRTPPQIVDLKLQNADSRLRIVDSELRNSDSTLQYLDSELQTLDSEIQIFDSQLQNARFEASKRRFEASRHRFEAPNARFEASKPCQNGGKQPPPRVRGNSVSSALVNHRQQRLTGSETSQVLTEQEPDTFHVCVGVTTHMRRDDDIGHAPQFVIRWQWLRLGNI